MLIGLWVSIESVIEFVNIVNYSCVSLRWCSASTMVSVEHIRTRVEELIAKHEPHKIDQTDLLMKKWKWKETYLEQTLCEKYNEESEKMTPKKIKDIYSIGSKIGTGRRAVVRKCKRKTDEKVFALKVIDKTKFDEEDLYLLDSEVNILRQLSHPNIVKFIDVFESRSKLCVFQPFLEGGELFDRIIEIGHFKEDIASLCFAHICRALQCLHDKKIA